MTKTSWRTYLTCALVGMLWGASSWAQTPEPSPLRLGGVLPGGVRSSATDRWGAYDLDVTNLSDKDRQARVLVRFADRPDVLYGRDLWVPAQSQLATWMLVGPAIRKSTDVVCSIEVLLFDRTDGGERRMLPPGETQVRSRAVLHRPREPFTAIMLDEEQPAHVEFGKLPKADSRDREALELARAFRLSRKLTESVQNVTTRTLPPNPQAFDGIDHFVLASNRIADDPAGLKALRHWVESGGKLWVMLDCVDPTTIAPLLGGACDFQMVDRVALTRFRIEPRAAGQMALAPAPLQEYDRPIDFVRVLLPDGEQAHYSINSWPIAFTRHLGRGKIVFTTLGPRAWYRPRTPREPRAAFPNYANFPVPLPHLEDVALELHPATIPSTNSSLSGEGFRAEAFQPMLTEQIGYAVVGRETVLLVFAAFLLGAVGLGFALRRTIRPELLGWLGPLAALGAAGVFLVLGEWSRRAVPPTEAIAQIADAVSGEEEASVHGLLATYRTDSGPAPMGAERGGFFHFDMAGLEGQLHRLILTDMDAWHWENVDLPAGVRNAVFRIALPTGEPLAASARFAAGGLEGKLSSGRFQDVEDALLLTAGGRNLAVRMRPDGTFEIRGSDVLSEGQFLQTSVLSDVQQRRQDVFRQFLQPPRPSYLDGRNVLFAWSKPLDPHFQFLSSARQVGSALLVVPLQFERPAPGRSVTIPGPLVSYQRILGNAATRPTFSWHQATEMLLRFQLPLPVLPFTVERVLLTTRISAPSRRVTVSGRDGKNLVEVHRVESPLDPLRIEITDPRLLHLDADGGLYLNVSIGGEIGRERKQSLEVDEKWKIDYLELEVSGKPEG